MSKRGVINILVSALVCLACSGNLALAQPWYSVTHIPNPYPPDQYSSASPLGLNDFGQVVGTYLVRDEMANLVKPGAFFYSDSTGTIDLPFPSELHTPWVEGINNSAQVTMYGNLPAQTYRYTPGLGYQTLGTFGGETESRAINNLGQVTGYSVDASGQSRAFRYTDGVGLQDIGGSYRTSVGRAINDRGWVAGIGDGNAVLFRDEGNITLLPGRAHGINNQGDVVGETSIVPGHDTAFVYRDGQFTILGDDVFDDPVLNDINGNREAVGYGLLPFSSSLTAVYWSETTGGLVDLNSLIPGDSGWNLGFATAINESGQIIGYGGYNGQFAMYRLDPIPEPSTWALMVLGGIAGLWAVSRRKKN